MHPFPAGDFRAAGAPRRKIQGRLAAPAPRLQVFDDAAPLAFPRRHDVEPSVRGIRIRREGQVRADRGDVEDFEEQELAVDRLVVEEARPAPRLQVLERLGVALDGPGQLRPRVVLAVVGVLLRGRDARRHEAASDTFEKPALSPLAARDAEIERHGPGALPPRHDLADFTLDPEALRDVVRRAQGKNREGHSRSRQRAGRLADGPVSARHHDELHVLVADALEIGIFLDLARENVALARERAVDFLERCLVARRGVVEEAHPHRALRSSERPRVGPAARRGRRLMAPAPAGPGRG